MCVFMNLISWLVGIIGDETRMFQALNGFIYTKEQYHKDKLIVTKVTGEAWLEKPQTLRLIWFIKIWNSIRQMNRLAKADWEKIQKKS